MSGVEEEPSQADRDKHVKFVARRDKALATVVLSVEPSLLYLLGEPVDPRIVWEKLRDQFQKKTWANKLSLRRRLYSLRLKNGDSMQDHIKSLTEIFDELAVVDDPVTEEDRVVHILASLPDSFNMLVTALEANADVPKMELFTERLLNEERKIMERVVDNKDKVLLSKEKRGPICYHCKKHGHIKRRCPELEKQSSKRVTQRVKHKVHKTKATRRNSSSSSESVGVVVTHALSTSATDTVDRWIVDSGATCHMTNNRKLFVKLQNFRKPLDVTLGDGHSLKDVELSRWS